MRAKAANTLNVITPPHPPNNQAAKKKGKNAWPVFGRKILTWLVVWIIFFRGVALAHQPVTVMKCFTPSAASSLDQGHNFYLSNHESRGRVLGMNGWEYEWYDAGGADTGRAGGIQFKWYDMVEIRRTMLQKGNESKISEITWGHVMLCI